MDNQEKFYIIKATKDYTGIGAILFNYLCHIQYAFKNDYIPIADLKTCKNQYFKDGKEFKDNVWEYFFEQPTKYNLKNIPENSKIIISENIERPLQIDNITASDIINRANSNIVQERKENFKKLIKFKPEIEQYFNDEYQRIINNETEVLGILCRGTDYIKKRPKNEPVQPSPKEVIKKAKELKKTYNYKKIYLATEDEKIYKMFKKEFGDMILDNNQYRYSKNYNKKYFLSEINVDRANHNYNLAKEYLASLYILSKCKYLIGGQTSGTKISALLSNGYEYGYIWQLGKYKHFSLMSLKKLYILLKYKLSL